MTYPTTRAELVRYLTENRRYFLSGADGRPKPRFFFNSIPEEVPDDYAKDRSVTLVFADRKDTEDACYIELRHERDVSFHGHGFTWLAPGGNFEYWYRPDGRALE